MFDLGNGTVLKVDGNIVTGQLDCQNEDETYKFHSANPNFCQGEMKNN